MNTIIKKKNIAINLFFLSSNNITGGFLYIQNLLDNLVKIDKNNHYYLILNRKNKYFKERYKKNKNIKFKIINANPLLNPLNSFCKILSKIQKNETKYENILKKEIQNYIDKEGIDIVFFPANIIYPRGLNRIKKIVTIFDLQHEYLPENFKKSYLEYRKNNFLYSATNSDHIIAISEYTKRSISEKYKIDLKKITTTYLGCDIITNPQSQISVPKNYIFYPAAFWPHKNHKILIQILNNLKNKYTNLELVFTGILKNEELKDQLERLITQNQLKNKIHFLGFVSNEDLNFIYKNAKLLVIPSSFEGFGMPVIEAFKHKIPVIAANNTSLKEIVNNEKALFETNNLEDLQNKIKKVLNNQIFRKKIISQGYAWSQNFSWEKTARDTLNVLENSNF
jgi:glycosyltransferase involved in cell wall biosynthesis